MLSTLVCPFVSYSLSLHDALPICMLLGVGILGGLLALLIAYFGNCVPGFGVGTSTPSTPAAPRTTAEPATADVAAGLKLTVDGDRCRRGDEAPLPCDQLCRALGGASKDQKVEVDGTRGRLCS